MKKWIYNFLPIRLTNWIEYKRQKLSLNERAVEYSFVMKHLAKRQPRKILDVGSGQTSLPSLMRTCGYLVTAIDINASNKHFHVLNKDIAQFKTDEKFDFITCISVLEHVEYPVHSVKNMLRLLRQGGHLVLTFPYTEDEYHPNVYLLKESNAYGKTISYRCRSFSRANLRLLNLNIVDQEYWRFWSGQFWTTGHKVQPVQVDKTDRHQLTCILIYKPIQKI